MYCVGSNKNMLYTFLQVLLIRQLGVGVVHVVLRGADAGVLHR